MSGCRFVVWRTPAIGCCRQGLFLSALVLSRPLQWLPTGSYRRANLCCCSQAVVERCVGSMVILIAIGSDILHACACHPLMGKPALRHTKRTSPSFATLAS